MNAYRLTKSDFTADLAVEADALSAEGAYASHDPELKRAIGAIFDLDDQGKRLDLEVSDVPYDALVRISRELHEFGVSNNLANEFVEVIETQAVHLGVDFTKKEKPTPMTVSLRVVDEEPQLDPGKTHFMVAYDRDGRHGGEFSKTVMKLGINGTQSSHTNVPKFEDLFAMGKKQYLIVHFEKLEGEGVGSLDQSGVQMATLVEAVGVAAAESRSGQEIKQAMADGSLPADTTKLIETVAEINSVVQQTRAPDAPKDAQTRLETLKNEVVQITDSMSRHDAAIPQALVKAVVASFDKQPVQQAPAVEAPAQAAPAKPEAAPAANNDNIAKPVAAAPVTAEMQVSQPVISTRVSDISAVQPEVKVAEAQVVSASRETLGASAAQPQVKAAEIQTPSIIRAVETIAATVQETKAQAPAASQPIAPSVKAAEPSVAQTFAVAPAVVSPVAHNAPIQTISTVTMASAPVSSVPPTSAIVVPSAATVEAAVPVQQVMQAPQQPQAQQQMPARTTPVQNAPVEKTPVQAQPAEKIETPRAAENVTPAIVAVQHAATPVPATVQNAPPAPQAATVMPHQIQPALQQASQPVAPIQPSTPEAPKAAPATNAAPAPIVPASAPTTPNVAEAKQPPRETVAPTTHVGSGGNQPSVAPTPEKRADVIPAQKIELPVKNEAPTIATERQQPVRDISNKQEPIRTPVDAPVRNTVENPIPDSKPSLLTTLHAVDAENRNIQTLPRDLDNPIRVWERQSNPVINIPEKKPPLPPILTVKDDFVRACSKCVSGMGCEKKCGSNNSVNPNAPKMNF
ncbi:MAG: hypothetical protein DI626_05705 [Micavibrio aeruginosavorus]|uniref:Uncharacterized protein n=1 Tax=Micavibrio aeruginosavorus TaxID=349221 RepID=A0A2W4ZWR4_9BACT|nr:MAG: hypothetical protein DI626_05705 [Micavibrio aeruginosavorus]